MRTVTAAAALLLASAVGLPGAEAGGPPHNGVNPTQDGQEVGARAGRPGTERTIDITTQARAGSSGPDNLCMDGKPGTWERWGDQAWNDHFGPVGRPAGVPEDAEFWYLHCPHLASFNTPGLERGHWSTTGQPDPPPSAQELVLPAWAYVRGLLQEPELQLTPAEGVDSVIFTPTFVAIGNPQPSTTYTAAAGGVEVWIAVVPTVTLHPGEPGAPAVACDDDGTAYDRAGPPPRRQADAEGACAHTYEHRTAAGEAWAGDVTIDWTVTWGSNIAGQSGDFSDEVVPSVTGFERVVEEVQSVVGED